MNLKNRLKSFKYAFAGFRDLWKTQPNARIHVYFGIVTVFAGFIFKISKNEWFAVLICIALVILTEALNTAVEHLADLITPEFHPLAGRAKDVAAAAVLIATFLAVSIGLIVFFPKIMSFLGFEIL